MLNYHISTVFFFVFRAMGISKTVPFASNIGAPTEVAFFVTTNLVVLKLAGQVEVNARWAPKMSNEMRVK